MPYQLPPDPRTERRDRVTRWVSFAFAAILVVLVAYLGYVGYEGSRQLADAPSPSTDCRTPAAFGWEYEAINYDRAADDALVDEPDPEACASRSAPAGDEVTGPDEIGLAGWYVPAGRGDGAAPTVVLTHGWGSNKSAMLPRAEMLQPRYNLLFVDLRNHGQSEAAPTTQGAREAADLRAMIDWLVETKGPERIAVLGVSMGGATALRAADRDDRVDALVIESTHATLTGAIQARLDGAGYPLSLPAAWATLLGSLMRTGEDVTVADPVRSLAGLDGRPLVLISGGGDTAIGPTDAADLLAAAQDAGSPVELHICAGARHAQSWRSCPEDYADWVLGFLERHLDASG